MVASFSSPAERGPRPAPPLRHLPFPNAMSTALLRSPLPAVVLPLALALALSGCTLLGLGAAAGAAVGGCALLDENEDDTVTAAEASSSVFNSWDTNDDARLSPAEFDAGAGSSRTYAGVSGSFNDWDTDDDGTLTRAEFSTGATTSGATADWLDARCDDLGL